MPNLLTLTELTKASEIGELYVVYNSTDYRMTVKTLLSLVTATSLGLNKVDNTADADKPISTAVKEALAEKADTSSVVSLTTYNALVQTLGNYVSLETMNAAIKAVTDTLNGYVTESEASALITAALAPITATITAVQQTLSSHDAAITALQNATGSYVSASTMATAIATAKADLEQTISSQATTFSQSISQLSTAIAALNQSVTAIETSLANKADKTHVHSTDDITGLETFIKQFISASTSDVTVGTTDW